MLRELLDGERANATWASNAAVGVIMVDSSVPVAIVCDAENYDLGG